MTSKSSNLTSHISFGCSNLLGDKTAQEGLALLNTAYESGIRSFDVARVYNFGDAERLVGQFSAERRSQLTITTKFGLTPNAAVARLGGAINLVRRVMRSSDFVRKLVRRNVSKITPGGRFDAATANASLTESLRALNTDYIDIYLLHEATPADFTDDLFAFLEKAVEQGKILNFGVGSGYHQIPKIAHVAPRFLGVAQFDSGPVDHHRRDFEAIRPAGNKLIITHGSFAGTEFMQEAIAAKAPMVRDWSNLARFDLSAPGLFHSALLRCALRANPEGKVIFRASTGKRTIDNLSALNTPLSDDQLDILETLCVETFAGIIPSTPAFQPAERGSPW